ncbi:hypothetical protein MKX03_007238 [Papaver bracteatum]|nr:hypothetical protein MKX03_007238 [Papaver bracteatum]
MLIQSIHSCAIKFPEVASIVVHLLMDFLGDTYVASSIDVDEIIETNPELRVDIITRLLVTFYRYSLEPWSSARELLISFKTPLDLKQVHFFLKGIAGNLSDVRRSSLHEHPHLILEVLLTRKQLQYASLILKEFHSRETTT